MHLKKTDIQTGSFTYELNTKKCQIKNNNISQQRSDQRAIQRVALLSSLKILSTVYLGSPVRYLKNGKLRL